MQLRYNFRVYPSAGQRGALSKAFGCARVVFNDGLRARQEAHAAGLPYIKDGDLQKQVVTAAKRTEGREWLGEVSSVVLVQSLRDLHTAYRNFFNSVSGKRKGPKVAPPRFKSKHDNRQAIRLTVNGFSLRSDGRLYIAKVGDLYVRWSRQLPAAPTSVTVTKDASNRYWASFVVDTERDVLPELDTEVGIDLGLTYFAVLSDGRKIESPKFLRRAEKKLGRMQRSLSRKEKGSKNRAKARAKVARQHAKVGDRRRDWHHKESTRVIRENQAVYVEDLLVSGLGRTRLAKSVHDAGWAQFLTMLEYKAALYGRTFAKVGRAFPSSQVCSVCGLRDGPKPLHIREWTCGKCATIHNRDHNASRNVLLEGRRIVAAGRAETPNACGAPVRRAYMPARRGEAGTHRAPRRGQ
ncbi:MULTISPECIES: RNA-guided endonuclease InsQ/TnpB family protein [Streptomyces]|jgi:putative transposase|uniref:Transposase n=3 Tax=Streptomyces TaxID=1883 RepID=A0AA37C0L7_9ACTN|nr:MULTISPECIES: RNA-guided endonuclease TnpB family protein [Streptomyces]MBK3386129.1 transposase [Streptomyces sp. DEF147AK]MBK3391684.1 transposase [Streptomyces sp. DEF1AK]MBV7250357.1 transposase [Streptomyces sp. S-2]MEE1721666.1 transposase [Streptomyces sp. JV186]RZE56620.1 transposase [Streptomyces albidoflavus]